MSITLNTLVYSYDAPINKNKVQYVGPDHTFSEKDIITLGRTAPKPTATFAGVARSEMKRTKTVTLADGSLADAIFTFSASVPVGIVQADSDALRDDVGDFAVAASGASMVDDHNINQ